jgi:hypothetical protein
VSLKSWAIRKVALRWLESSVKNWRKNGGPMGKALRLADGWKSFIVGWADVELIERAKLLATVVVPLLFALWAGFSRVKKAVQQFRAGANPSELLSAEGYVKQAVADGTLEKMLPLRRPD